MRVSRTMLFTLLLACGPALPAQQTCDTRSFPLSSPGARFHDNNDGTVSDTRSGLTWMRCSTGQTWVGQSCVGQAETHSLASALDVANSVNQRGVFFYMDWRVPQIHELASITERQCENPRINLSEFPNTPAEFYWTLTARPGAAEPASGYALSFGAEGLRYENRADAHHVRLVRSGN